MVDKKIMVAQAIKIVGKHASDTGSMEVQAALLTERIKSLTDHLKLHKKDYSSKHGLNKLLARRKSSLQYLKKNDDVRYQEVIKQLGLKK